MGSTYIVFLRNKDNIPVAVLDDQRDAACYYRVKDYLWTSARGADDDVVFNESWGIQHPGFQEHYQKHLEWPGDPLNINLQVVCSNRYGSAATYSVPAEQQLIRVYFKRQYRYPNDRDDKVRPLPLADDEFAVGGYINPRFVGKYFKDTLRMIPELQDYIGPNDDPLSIDVLLGRHHVRQTLLLLWLVRRLNENPNGYTVPNIVITARALASIAPGLAYYYLLTLEAAWLGAIREPLYGNIGYESVPVDKDNPWHKNINHPRDMAGRSDANESHCLNAFRAEVTLALRHSNKDHSLHLSNISSIIRNGVLPETIGDRDYFNRLASGTLLETDTEHHMVNKITTHRGLKRPPKGYGPGDKMDVFHFGLFPDQVEQAYHEIRDHGCIKNAEILDQLNNVIQTLARRPINYFIKGWKADA